MQRYATTSLAALLCVGSISAAAQAQPHLRSWSTTVPVSGSVTSSCMVETRNAEPSAGSPTVAGDFSCSSGIQPLVYVVRGDGPPRSGSAATIVERSSTGGTVLVAPVAAARAGAPMTIVYVL